jgi:predicted ATPase
MQSFLEIEQADLVGQLAGFDFKDSPAVQRLLGNPSFARMACLYIVNYFRRLAEKPLLVLLEDLHWTDDSSLDLITELVASLGRESENHLMIVCTARSQFFERRPKWGEGIAGFTRLELPQLSRLRSRALVTEILCKVENVPEALYECILDEAEGNPFFIEELIKMLIDEDVIEIGAETWQVKLEKLAEVLVPPTLTGILQARLDSLPAPEKLVLQGWSGSCNDRRRGRSTSCERTSGSASRAWAGFSPRAIHHNWQPGIPVQTRPASGCSL